MYPSFIVDSVNAGRLLDWRKYRLWDSGAGTIDTKEALNIKGYLSKPDQLDSLTLKLAPNPKRAELG